MHARRLYWKMTMPTGISDPRLKAVGLAGVPLHQFGQGQNPTDPETNLSTAFGRLKELHAETGDWDKAATRLFGAADRQGNPRVLGPGADGFQFQQRFRSARQRFGGQ